MGKEKKIKAGIRGPDEPKKIFLNSRYPLPRWARNLGEKGTQQVSEAPMGYGG